MGQSRTCALGFPTRKPLVLPMPNTQNGTVPPTRQLNAVRRPREYLTPKEVELLRKAARERGRYGHRDATMILVAYRHGLRPIEVCALRWDQVDLSHGLLHVQRVKNGMPSVHPIGGSEIRDLRRLKREQPEGRHVFLTERAAPMTTAGFRKMIERAGESGAFPFPVHPHMLRHACGYKLSNDGQDTRAVQHSSDTKTFSTRSATPSCRPRASNPFGRIDPSERHGSGQSRVRAILKIGAASRRRPLIERG